MFISSVMGLYNPIMVTDENSNDVQCAKILMNSVYSHEDISIINNDEIDVNESIIYDIPAINEFNIKNRDEELNVKFEKDDGSSVRFNDVECIERMDTSESNINFLGKEYKIIKHTPYEIVLSDRVKNISTNKSFVYDNYTITTKAMTFDGSELIISISKNGKVIEDNIKLDKGELVHIPNTSIMLCYKNLSKDGKKNIFSFELYDTIQLTDDEDFELNNSYKVYINNNKVILKYKHPENLKNEFNIFNYNVKVNTYASNNMVNFKVAYNNEYKLKKEDINGTECIGNNIFVVNYNNSLFLYKDGKRINRTVEYMGQKNIVYDSSILKSNGDIILIGGPITNSITKKISNELAIPITNKNPGRDTGVIQKIKNPYNPTYNIYVLAGSDRWGTKACVLALADGLYNGEKVMVVRLKNNKPEIVRK